MNKEKLFNAWLNSTQEYIFFKGIDGKYNVVSNATAKLAGFETADEMAGKYDVEIYPAKLAQAFLIQDRRVIEDNEIVIDANWVEHPKLGKILIETVKSPLYDENGIMIGVQGISRNITEKYNFEKKFQAQESRLQTILDCLPIPLWIKDNSNHYLSVNEQYKKFYKINDEILFGHNISTVLKAHKLFSDENIKVLQEQDRFVLDNKKSKKIKIKVNFNDGEHELVIIKSPVMTKNDNCIGLIGICQDITHKK